MQKQKELTKRKSIAAFILWGLIGCGVGGAIGFLIGWAIAESAVRGWGGLYVFSLTGYSLAGAGAGIALGLAAKRSKVPVVALAGAFGFVFAHLVSMFGSALLPAAISRLSASTGIDVGRAITEAIFGAFGGAVLGLVLRGWRGAGFLALAGTIAGTIVGAILPILVAVPEIPSQNPQISTLIFLFFLRLVISNVAMGAAMGAALGYLEKRKAEMQG